MTADLQKILVSEFTCYFNGDETDWTPEVLETSLGQIADDSAQRLCSKVSPEERPALVALLRELQADRRHLLHQKITSHSQVSWTSNDEQFAYFRRLTAALIARIESTTD